MDQRRQQEAPTNFNNLSRLPCKIQHWQYRSSIVTNWKSSKVSRILPSSLGIWNSIKCAQYIHWDTTNHKNGSRSGTKMNPKIFGKNFHHFISRNHQRLSVIWKYSTEIFSPFFSKYFHFFVLDLLYLRLFHSYHISYWSEFD